MRIGRLISSTVGLLVIMLAGRAAPASGALIGELCDVPDLHWCQSEDDCEDVTYSSAHEDCDELVQLVSKGMCHGCAAEECNANELCQQQSPPDSNRVGGECIAYSGEPVCHPKQ